MNQVFAEGQEQLLELLTRTAGEDSNRGINEVGQSVSLEDQLGSILTSLPVVVQSPGLGIRSPGSY